MMQQNKCNNCWFYKKETELSGRCSKILEKVSLINDAYDLEGTYLLVNGRFWCNLHIDKVRVFESVIVAHVPMMSVCSSVGKGASIAFEKAIKSSDEVIIIDDYAKINNNKIMLDLASKSKDLIKPFSTILDTGKRKINKGTNNKPKKKKRKKEKKKKIEDMEDEIIIKDMTSFMMVKNKLDQNVFWTKSDTQEGKVEIKLALNKGFSRKILSTVKD